VSTQRKHGQPVTIYPRKLTIDSRGNDVLTIDKDNPFNVTAAVIPQRSSKAEVPGQQEINVVRLIVDASLDIESVGLWGGAHYAGEDWDIAAPPAYHHGSRRVRHISIDIRKRP